MDLKNRDDAVIYSADVATMHELVERAVREGKSLYRASLYGANLVRADLGGAYLVRADLADATLSWSSHWLLSEILWRAAGDDADCQQFAAWVGRRTDMCWDKWHDYQHPCRDWAIAELSKWVRDGDDAPEWIREAAKVGVVATGKEEAK